MIKLPLKKPILLIMENGQKYFCRIIYSSNVSITAVDVIERLFSEDGSFIDYTINGKVILDRNKLIGYSKIEEIEDDPDPKKKLKFRILTGGKNQSTPKKGHLQKIPGGQNE